jgi:hypothetical protein
MHRRQPVARYVAIVRNTRTHLKIAATSQLVPATKATLEALAAPVFRVRDNTNTILQTGNGTIADCKCNTGYTGSDGQACKPYIGSWKAVTESAACIICERRKYRSAPAGQSQDNCYSRRTFASPRSDSMPGSSTICYCKCNVGYIGVDSESCETCDQGKYKDTTGDHPCLDCAAGKYSWVPAADTESACINCATGKFSDKSGVSGEFSCTSCADDSSSREGSIDDSTCFCNRGYWGVPSNGGDCRACDRGKCKTTTGSVSCTNCFAHVTTVGAGTVSFINGFSTSIFINGVSGNQNCRYKEGFTGTTSC